MAAYSYHDEGVWVSNGCHNATNYEVVGASADSVGVSQVGGDLVSVTIIVSFILGNSFMVSSSAVDSKLNDHFLTHMGVGMSS